MGIPLIAGRDFAVTDTASGPKVVIVNEAFLKQLPHGWSPMGSQLVYDDVPWRIVGVVADAMFASIREGAPPTIYQPFLPWRLAWR